MLPRIPVPDAADAALPCIRLAASALAEVRAHARDSYPHECCGALLGRDHRDGMEREVLRALRLANESPGPRARRFLLNGGAVLAAERAASAAGLALLGFYHSHPDSAPVPSSLDREQAWPWFTYLIVGVRGGDPGPARAWSLAGDRARFHERALLLTEEP